MATSFLNPLISVSVTELESLIDTYVPSVLFDDAVGNGIMIKASKEGSIKLSMEFNRILYQVPVRLQVKKDIGISIAKTNCKLIMQFKTVFVIASDWSIRTKTELQKYGWLEEPKLDLGFLSVPIVTILEGVLNSKKHLICEAIDTQLKNIKFETHLQTIVSSIDNPLQVPIVGQVFWASSEVQSSLHPLEVIDGKLQVTVGLKSDLKVGIGTEIPTTTLKINPPEFTKQKRSPSQLKLRTSTAISTIEKIFNKEFSGHSYEVEQYNITPSHILISCDGNRMTLKSNLTGSFSGQVTLHGIPFFNPDDRTLYCREVDVELEGSGFKSKSILLLASTLIKKKVEENLKFPIDPIVDDFNKQINKYVFEGAVFKGYIIKYKLSNLKMNTESIDVDVDVEALISLEKK